MSEKKIHQTHFQVPEMPWKQASVEDIQARVRISERIVRRFGISVGEIVDRVRELREKSKHK